MGTNLGNIMGQGRVTSTFVICAALLGTTACDREPAPPSSVEATATPRAPGSDRPVAPDGAGTKSSSATAASPSIDDAADPDRTTGSAAASERDPVEEKAPSDLPVESLDDDTAAELIEPVLVSDSRALSNPAGEEEPEELAAVVAEDALSQARAAAQEYADLGWRQVGVPVIASARVLELEEDTDPPTARLEACLDHSGVDVVAADGVSVIDPGAPRRVLNLFDLERRDGVWIVVDRTFPVETDC